MSEGKIVQTEPYVIEEEGGKVAWCACGLSQNQPYCDGSHKSTEMTPIAVEVEKGKKVAWCGCKRSGNKPYCDGTHTKL